MNFKNDQNFIDSNESIKTDSSFIVIFPSASLYWHDKG